jgi:DNA-binding transcriptional LysR family regulator
MNFELLRTFVVFAKSKNIVAAAKELQVSQPAVTMQLRRLEQDFSHPLFSQEGKKKTLTPFGRALLGEVAPLIERIGTAVQQVENRFSDPSQLLLRVGARAEMLSRIVQKIKFPGSIQFIPLPSRNAVDLLLSHEIDIAIASGGQRPDLAYIHSKRVFSDRVQWICHKKWLKNQTAEQASGSLEFLLQTPFLAYKTEMPFLKEWLNHLGHSKQAASHRPHRICEDWNAILKQVEQGLGYTLAPSSLVAEYLENPDLKTRMLPTEALPEMTFYALYHFDLMKIPAIEKSLLIG